LALKEIDRFTTAFFCNRLSLFFPFFKRHGTMPQHSFYSKRLLQNVYLGPIPMSGSDFNPQNTQCIHLVKIIAFLEREQK